MKRILAGIGIVAALASGSLAEAPAGNKYGGDAAIARMFEMLDRSGDGALQASEVAGSNLAQEFAAMDADANGNVTRAEFTTFRVKAIDAAVAR
jgi:hypothetical protein